MRPPATAIIETAGGFGSDTLTVNMSIAPEDFGHIFSMLTDMYSDRILACIREYSTNAWDSHVQAGHNRHIEVTLPNTFSPHFRVRDFGPGMSFSTRTEIFSQYGRSTKRGEDVSNGQFGIGGKAALTYTKQFTVSSVFNGRKITAVVSRIAEIPTLEVIDDRESSEPSG